MVRVVNQSQYGSREARLGDYSLQAPLDRDHVGSVPRPEPPAKVESRESRR